MSFIAKCFCSGLQTYTSKQIKKTVNVQGESAVVVHNMETNPII